MAPNQKINIGVAPVEAQVSGQGIGRLPIRRVDGISITRTLPATISASEAAQAGNRTPGASLMQPTIEVPGYEIDYPVVDVPTQAEFDAAVKGHDKETKPKETDEAAGAKNLASKLPPTSVLTQAQPQVPVVPTTDLRGTQLPGPPTPAVAANPAGQTGTEVTLPFLGTVPMPSKEALTLASTTAVTATFVAVVGKAALETSMEGLKPLARLAMIRYKKLTSKGLNHEEVQLDFAHQLGKKNVKHNIFTDVVDYVRKHFFEDLIG